MIDPGIAEAAAYDRAHAALLGLIHDGRRDSPSPRERRRRAAARLERGRRLLVALGNPQRRYPIVHVTGTSGKGSTCTAVAAMLTAAGYRVGLRTSPYVQVATEKLQIGSALIAASEFASLTDTIMRTGDELWPGDSSERLGYATAWTALSLSWFAARQVDIAIVEVGAGGRYDATNVVEPVVSVITSVGLDHLVSLGPELADIAWHKSGIIKPGAIAVIGDIPAEAMAPIVAAATDIGVPLWRATDRGSLEGLMPDSAPEFQLANARVAVTVVEALRARGFIIPVSAVHAGLSAYRLPARFEPMPGTSKPRVWIDGAHNPDKIAAAMRETGRLAIGGRGPVVLLGLIGAKDAAAAITAVARVASAIVATEPSALGKIPRPAAALANAMATHGFTGAILADADPDSAFDRAFALAAETETDLLVTGSLYLAGQIRQRWYSNTDIVIQRTPWPIRMPETR